MYTLHLVQISRYGSKLTVSNAILHVSLQETQIIPEHHKYVHLIFQILKLRTLDMLVVAEIRVQAQTISFDATKHKHYPN